MKRMEVPQDTFSLAIQQATQALRIQDAQSALLEIEHAIVLNMDAPEPHNLLGIYAELIGDDSAARKHYRAAYALDPTYKPACRNLERLVMYQWGPQRRDFDFGASLELEQPQLDANRDGSPLSDIQKTNHISI